MERIYIKENNLFYLSTYVIPVKAVIYYDIYQTILRETRDKKKDISQAIIIVRKSSGDNIIKKDINSIVDIEVLVNRYSVDAEKIYIDRYVDHSILYIEVDFDRWIERKFEEIEKDYMLSLGKIVEESEKGGEENSR